MRLNGDVFQIDAAAYTDRLCDFIARSRSDLHRDGILVSFSGGLDSSTVLLLCARAVGREHVTALLMPEKQGNPDAERYARLVADRYQIKTITRDISPVLASLGTYKFILSALAVRPLQNWAAQAYLRSARRMPMRRIVQGEASDMERIGYAKFTSKQRVRAVVAYLMAEEMNLLVAGCAHKSEDMVGLFVKFGVDDIADIMPLKHLYRSQTLQLARFLGVPEEILNRSPNPDIIPGVNDKYVDLLELPADAVDLVLFGMEQGLEDREISEQLNLALEKVADIRTLVKATEHMRRPSLTLTWEGWQP